MDYSSQPNHIATQGIIARLRQPGAINISVYPNDRYIIQTEIITENGRPPDESNPGKNYGIGKVRQCLFCVGRSASLLGAVVGSVPILPELVHKQTTRIKTLTVNFWPCRKGLYFVFEKHLGD